MVEEITIKPKFTVAYILVVIFAVIALGLTSYFYYSGSMLPEFFTVFFFGIMILSSIAFLSLLLKYVSTTYTITNKEVISTEGLVTRTKRSVQFTKIDHIIVTRSIRDILMQTGSIHIDTPGGPEMAIVMGFIDSGQIQRYESVMKELMEEKQDDKPSERPQKPAYREPPRYEEYPAEEEPAKEKPAKKRKASRKKKKA